jgi:hypothetical protein
MKCAACGASNPAGAEWCSLCLVRFNALPETDPARSSHADGPVPFARTRSTLLVPRPVHDILEYIEPGTDDVQAVVRTLRLLDDGGERHTCFDLDDVPLFYVEPYRAVDAPAVTAFSPDGQPLATFLTGTGVDGIVAEVRDGTGAPLATMGKSHDRMALIETGGRQLGECWRQDLECGLVIEDEWGLTVFETPTILDRLAVVALPLACRALFYRHPRPRMTDDQHHAAIPLVELSFDLLGSLLSS